MGVERRGALFRELKENSWKEGRALEETMERSAGAAWEGIVLLSRLVPVRVLIKPGPPFFSLFSEKLPGQSALFFLSVSLNPPLSSFYRPRLDPFRRDG